MNRSWLAYRFFNLVSFVYNSWFGNVNAVGPPTRLPQTLDRLELTLKRLWIMIAGPYTSGAQSHDDRANNLRALNAVAYEVFKKGHVPIIGVNLALPIIDVAGQERFDELMMPISFAAAERCDAVLRVGGRSIGADEEVEQIRVRGGRVYGSLDDIPVVGAV